MATLKAVRDKRSDSSYESYDIYNDDKWIAYTTKTPIAGWHVCIWTQSQWKSVVTLPPDASADDAIATTKTYALLVELK